VGVGLGRGRCGFAHGALLPIRQRMLPSRYRLLTAVIAARRSRDRSALDSLLEPGDLPEGWHQRRETRARVGFVFNREFDQRARRAKLVTAGRSFSHPGTNTRLLVQALPAVNLDDAREALSRAWEHRLPIWELSERTVQEVEVTPPNEAGEHARALLAATTDRRGDWHSLSVAWVEQSPMLFAIILKRPANADLWEMLAGLIERQRKRFAQRATLSK